VPWSRRAPTILDRPNLLCDIVGETLPAAAAAAAARVTVEILKCPPESVDIVITEVPREAWAKAGKLFADG
jgi:phenylpyruvate tautomerase PptA (4-oxalocrotonate tautomerase family)